jgi:hypothetical protein
MRKRRPVKLSTGGHERKRGDTGGHHIRPVRDREAPGSNPGPPTISQTQKRYQRRKQCVIAAVICSSRVVVFRLKDAESRLKLYVAGGIHHDPWCRGVLSKYLHSLIKSHEQEPRFVAVEMDQAITLEVRLRRASLSRSTECPTWGKGSFLVLARLINLQPSPSQSARAPLKPRRPPQNVSENKDAHTRAVD